MKTTSAGQRFAGSICAVAAGLLIAGCAGVGTAPAAPAVEARVADLVAQMTLQEKAGLMLIQTLNGDCAGALQPSASAFINQQQMHRFVIRNVVNAQGSCGADAGIRAGSQLTPVQAATFTNGVQAMAEATRLGIPALFKSNARNHFERDAPSGINNSSGSSPK